MPEQVSTKYMMAIAGVAIATFEKGDRVEAARLLEGLAANLRLEARAAAMAGTARVDAQGRVIRHCRVCGRGIVVVGPRAFRADRKFCSDACRQADYRKRQPPKPRKLAKVIALGPPA